MSVHEDSFKSPLQGVSQQIPRERLDGQVTEQVNMLSDVVQGLRRRKGASFVRTIGLGSTAQTTLAFGADIGGDSVHVVVDTTVGKLLVFSSTYNLVFESGVFTYLQTTDASNIKIASVGDELFFANTTKVPVRQYTPTGGSEKDPDTRGFISVRTGAFSRKYEVFVQSSVTGSVPRVYSMTTPDGTSAGDANIASPNFIAATLTSQINADTASTGMTALYYDGTVYVYAVSTATGLRITEGVGAEYMVVSGAHYVRQSSDLPANLGPVGNGFIMTTGDLKTPVYFKFDYAGQRWLESGDFLSSTSITNVPISLTNVGGTWAVLGTPFEGRFAGDYQNNPEPEMLKGITGLSSYQGRLVVLSGSTVSMSASMLPRRFYRSTTVSLVDSDTISIAASVASSAAWKHAVQFNKDLLVFSDKYQGVVPSAQTALTPKTASIVITSQYDTDNSSSPLVLGRSLMYSAPRSAAYFGLQELVPSSTTDNQYVSSDAVAHLPTYMPGRLRGSASSSGNNIAVFLPSGSTNTIIVHEYLWSGDTKVQQAWHKWVFEYPVVSVWFSGQLLHVLFMNGSIGMLCTLDQRSASTNALGEQYPYLDFSSFSNVGGGVLPLNGFLNVFDNSIHTKYALSVATGAQAGSPVQVIGRASTELTTDASFLAGRVSIGIPYRSSFIPTPPMKKDTQGVKISTNKLTILRYLLSTNNSQKYDVTLSDSTGVPDEYEQSPLYFSSEELALGTALVGADSTAVIPARVRADTSRLEVSTDGTGDLNIVGLEYVARYAQKIARTQHR